MPPPLFDALAADPRVDERDLSSLRLVVTGGAHVPADVEQALSERLGCVARQGYGTTETTCTISAPLVGPSTPGTAGWLVPGTEARLVDPETGVGRRARASRASSGSAARRSCRATTAAPRTPPPILTPDGWLRTGDLVAIRDDGQLEIRDRLKELIKVKGASVAPAEIELVLRQHPAVRDAGVVGVPDAERGEAPIAFVALDARGGARRARGLRRRAPGRATSARARSWSSTRCRALPTGKLLRRALRERAPALRRA